MNLRLSNNFADWESGHYDASGNKSPFVSRIRLIDLWEVPQSRLYFNTNGIRDTLRFVLRSYNSSRVFLQNIGEIQNGYISNFSVSTAYLGVSIYDSASSALTFADYQSMFANGDIKPWISLA